MIRAKGDGENATIERIVELIEPKSGFKSRKNR
jgi:hypothetical protein